MTQTEITIQRAWELDRKIRKAQLRHQADFLESNCELFDKRDLFYYADETGKGIDWVMENGTNIDPELRFLWEIGELE